MIHHKKYITSSQRTNDIINWEQVKWVFYYLYHIQSLIMAEEKKTYRCVHLKKYTTSLLRASEVSDNKRMWNSTLYFAYKLSKIGIGIWKKYRYFLHKKAHAPLLTLYNALHLLATIRMRIQLTRFRKYLSVCKLRLQDFSP